MLGRRGGNIFRFLHGKKRQTRTFLSDLTDFTDLSGEPRAGIARVQTHTFLNDMPLKYFMPLKERRNGTLASPARGLPLKSVESVKSVKSVK